MQIQFLTFFAVILSLHKKLIFYLVYIKNGLQLQCVGIYSAMRFLTILCWFFLDSCCNTRVTASMNLKIQGVIYLWTDIFAYIDFKTFVIV